MENRVLEYRSICLVLWNFGTRILSETVLTVEKTIFRKTRKKDTIWLTARSYTVRHYLRQIWKCKEISGFPYAAFQWRILTSDFSCHGLSPSHVLEHGTSGYVCILEEYGSVSWNFSTAIRLISHSVGISHTLLPKPTRSVYEKLNVTFGTPLVDLIEYPSRGIMIFISLVNIVLVVL